ncbi:Ig-like domain-containing protein [Streptomyces sp. JJ36]|uniref:L,D-transpeptidase n=1 Tax=Streptomyces sp. JJ36 TaxID=2736645 RepID=UPI001F3922AE|nr:Ig-like domain-containing protein [Streptomyces sp. JJ36]MCF6522961.1 L,D-transpeptidase family protein [Streptomyces sp. JJ36]
MRQRPKRNRRTALSCALVLAPLAAGLTACSDDGNPLAAEPYDASEQISVSVAEGSDDADYDKPLKITAEDVGGRITDVVAVDGAGRYLRGRLAPDGSSWRSTAPLHAGVRYTVRISTEDDSGKPGRRTLRFATRPADGRKLKVTFGPEKGTYGVGQPVVAELSHKLKSRKEKAVVERALEVESSPLVRGGWHWVDDRTLHYRPREYWPENADISVRSTLEGVRIRDGLRGGASKPLRIRTDDRVEALVDIAAHTMTVSKSGEKLKTIPVTTGKAGFRTRSGIKVILAKQQFVRMTSGSIGIPAGSAESYDLPVYWNARLTQSGEFVHAAPWSTGSQGAANVSHGCTGMSTADAKWFYHLVQPGDIVRYVNGQGEDMPVFGNGYGDWNLSWEKWRRGSATHRAAGGSGDETHATGRLRFDT